MSAASDSLVIAELAQSEAALRDALRSEVEARDIALSMLHDEQERHRRLRESHHRLLEEFRQLRVQTLRQADVAA